MSHPLSIPGILEPPISIFASDKAKAIVFLLFNHLVDQVHVLCVGLLLIPLVFKEHPTLNLFRMLLNLLKTRIMAIGRTKRLILASFPFHFLLENGVFFSKLVKFVAHSLHLKVLEDEVIFEFTYVFFKLLDLILIEFWSCPLSLLFWRCLSLGCISWLLNLLDWSLLFLALLDIQFLLKPLLSIQFGFCLHFFHYLLSSLRLWWFVSTFLKNRLCFVVENLLEMGTQEHAIG